MNVDERRKHLKAIIDSFDVMKRLLKEKAVCGDNRIVVFDPPFTLHILKNQMCMHLFHEEEEIGFLSLHRNEFCDAEAEAIMDSWLQALTSFGFRRYRIKRKS
ncbi:MAG: hypothetical protein H0Z28_02480 [Archaeoglobus sp.]|nr:hypothetical protein [Archaeoglobus sp.]